MKIFAALVVSLFFAAASAVPSCAHVEPVASCLARLGDGLALLARAESDFASDNYPDLIQIAVTRGWPVLDCIISEVEGKNPSLAPKAKAFRSQHATQLKGGVQ